MGKAVKKIAKTLSKFSRSPIADPLGLSKTISLSPVEDTLAGRSSNPLEALMSPEAGAQRELAAKQAEDDLRRQEAIAAQTRNESIDLSMENVANVEAGGTAQAQANANKRRRGTGGVAASLGINV